MLFDILYNPELLTVLRDHNLTIAKAFAPKGKESIALPDTHAFYKTTNVEQLGQMSVSDLFSLAYAGQQPWLSPKDQIPLIACAMIRRQQLSPDGPTPIWTYVGTHGGQGHTYKLVAYLNCTERRGRLRYYLGVMHWGRIPDKGQYEVCIPHLV